MTILDENERVFNLILQDKLNLEYIKKDTRRLLKVCVMQNEYFIQHAKKCKTSALWYARCYYYYYTKIAMEPITIECILQAIDNCNDSVCCTRDNKVDKIVAECIKKMKININDVSDSDDDDIKKQDKKQDNNDDVLKLKRSYVEYTFSRGMLFTQAQRKYGKSGDGHSKVSKKRC